MKPARIPSVHSSGWSILRIKLENWHEFDRRYSEFLQIRNLFDQPCKRAAFFLRNAGTRVASEPAHMHFINDGSRRGFVERCVSLPVISMRICDDAFNRHRGVIAFRPSCVATVILWNNHAAPVRIKEDFGRVETHSTSRIESSHSSITVDLSCFHPRYENVPIVISPVDRGIDREHTLGASVINAIKKKEFDPRCML